MSRVAGDFGASDSSVATARTVVAASPWGALPTGVFTDTMRDTPGVTDAATVPPVGGPGFVAAGSGHDRVSAAGCSSDGNGGSSFFELLFALEPTGFTDCAGPAEVSESGAVWDTGVCLVVLDDRKSVRSTGSGLALATD